MGNTDDVNAWQAVVDLKGVQTDAQFHAVIKAALEFPDYYGCNWAAFDDCMGDWYYMHRERGVEQPKIKFLNTVAAVQANIERSMVFMRDSREQNMAWLFE